MQRIFLVRCCMDTHQGSRALVETRIEGEPDDRRWHNRLDEAAYFETGTGRYRVQVTITPEAMSQETDREECLSRRSGGTR